MRTLESFQLVFEDWMDSIAERKGSTESSGSLIAAIAQFYALKKLVEELKLIGESLDRLEDHLRGELK